MNSAYSSTVRSLLLVFTLVPPWFLARLFERHAELPAKEARRASEDCSGSAPARRSSGRRTRPGGPRSPERERGGGGRRRSLRSRSGDRRPGLGPWKKTPEGRPPPAGPHGPYRSPSRRDWGLSRVAPHGQVGEVGDLDALRCGDGSRLLKQRAVGQGEGTASEDLGRTKGLSPPRPRTPRWHCRTWPRAAPGCPPRRHREGRRRRRRPSPAPCAPKWGVELTEKSRPEARDADRAARKATAARTVAAPTTAGAPNASARSRPLPPRSGHRQRMSAPCAGQASAGPPPRSPPGGPAPWW